MTILGRLIEQGPTGAGQQGRPPISIPEPIARVDAAVGQLIGIERSIICIRYVYCPHLSAEQQRKKLNMSEHRWVTKLRNARRAIKVAIDV